MSHPSSIEPTKESATQSEHVDISDNLKEKDVRHSDVLVNPDLMHEAFDGENREHEMGVWEAVQTYPWACFWATLMCFTIVSAAVALPSGLSDAQRSLVSAGRILADTLFFLTGDGVLRYVPQRQLCRPSRLQGKIRCRSCRISRKGHRDQMAEFALPGRSVRCVRWSLDSRSHHQPNWLPLDHHLGTGAYERDNLYLLLRKFSRAGTVARR